jgi:hypothetical protein
MRYRDNADDIVLNQEVDGKGKPAHAHRAHTKFIDSADQGIPFNPSDRTLNFQSELVTESFSSRFIEIARPAQLNQSLGMKDDLHHD